MQHAKISIATKDPHQHQYSSVACDIGVGLRENSPGFAEIPSR